MIRQHPKVFMSYSRDNDEIVEWVRKLATDLRGHGVDVILDQWDLQLGQDLRFFMEQGLGKSQLVLCICSDMYVEKVNRGRNGAGYEGMIMTQSLLQNCDQNYIIPIMRYNRLKKMPIAFASKYYLDFTDDNRYYENYKELLETIYDQKAAKKPTLGESPYDTLISSQITVQKEIDKIKYISSKMQGNVSFRYVDNNGVFNLGVGEYLFSTRWSSCNDDAIYAYGDIGYLRSKRELPKMEEISSFNFSSNVRKINLGEVVIFRNENGHFVAVKIMGVSSSDFGSKDDVVNFEYHIYE